MISDEDKAKAEALGIPIVSESVPIEGVVLELGVGRIAVFQTTKEDGTAGVMLRDVQDDTVPRVYIYFQNLQSLYKLQDAIAGVAEQMEAENRLKTKGEA